MRSTVKSVFMLACLLVCLSQALIWLSTNQKYTKSHYVLIMLVSAILNATISYHNYFKVAYVSYKHK